MSNASTIAVALEVGEKGKGAPLCAGDTVRAPDGQARVLGYGETLSRAGFSCTSQRSGITCRNKAGHGFTAARKAQKVFWRRRKLKSTVELELADGTPVAKATVAGMGVPRD